MELTMPMSTMKRPRTHAERKAWREAARTEVASWPQEIQQAFCSGLIERADARQVLERRRLQALEAKIAKALELAYPSPDTIGETREYAAAS